MILFVQYFFVTLHEKLFFMLFGLLLSALTATIEITSSKSVEATGMPQGASATYSRTASSGTSGQMTAGNSTTLLLEGWGGCTIESVSLQMHSNKKAGAGSLLMRIGTNTVWEIADNDFANVAWNGSFSSDWVNIEHSINRTVESGEDISIYIEASKNSLYVAGYTIKYVPPVQQPGVVKLVTGLDVPPIVLTESTPGSGVVLPVLSDTLEWSFVGWSAKEVQDRSFAGDILAANSRFYPSVSATLWAVYTDGEGYSEQTTEFVSGDYVMANLSDSAAMSGPVVALPNSSTQKYINTAPILWRRNESGTPYLTSSISDNMIYQIDFLPDSTLTIHHPASNSYIGYSGIKVSNRSVAWQYRMLADGSLAIWHVYSQRTYVLFFLKGIEFNCPDDVIVYSPLITLSSYKEDGIVLFPVVQSVYTTWPFGRYSDVPTVEPTVAKKGISETSIYFGMYEVRIKDGKKQLFLQK